MFKKNDPTETTLTFGGREYLVRQLPAKYQSTSESKRSTYWASIDGEILSTTKHGVVHVRKPMLVKNYQGELRKRYNLRVPQHINYYGHVLVASAWCEGKDAPDPQGNVRDQVNHIDQNQLNNAASNLHYVSARENNHHARVVMPAAALERRYSAGEQSAEMDHYDAVVAEWLSDDEEVVEYFGKADAVIVQWLTYQPQPRRQV